MIAALAVEYLLTGVLRVDLENLEDFADLVFVNLLEEGELMEDGCGRSFGFVRLRPWFLFA